jgi:hypothetical protein
MGGIPPGPGKPKVPNLGTPAFEEEELDTGRRGTGTGISGVSGLPRAPQATQASLPPLSYGTTLLGNEPKGKGSGKIKDQTGPGSSGGGNDPLKGNKGKGNK